VANSACARWQLEHQVSSNRCSVDPLTIARQKTGAGATEGRGHQADRDERIGPPPRASGFLSPAQKGPQYVDATRARAWGIRTASKPRDPSGSPVPTLDVCGAAGAGIRPAPFLRVPPSSG
jgi:hypothetical protein